ncbi:MAG: hypothetical protein HY427_01695 [Candidatus Levybacteria bacterium]|nr:hypothetical protein [Candidatus Levybacteria bacterium]
MENLKSGFEFIFASYKRTAAILFIGALVLAIPITVTLVKQQQDIRQRAAANPALIPGCGSLGDVNGDGKINSIDSSLILQYEAGLIPITKIIAANSDVNKDGKINSIDSSLILQYEAGLISTFPGCNTNVISGTVFQDNNGNAVQDSGETDYSGAATIKLDRSTTATKYGNGYYFTDVASGKHEVALTVPSGYGATTDTFASVTVPPSPGTFKFGIRSTGTPSTPTPKPTSFLPTPTPTRAPTPTVPPSSLCGDVNGDGKINSVDSALILQKEAGLITFTPAQLIAGDVNGDGRVNSVDSSLVLQYEAGLISSFPGGCPSSPRPTSTPTPKPTSFLPTPTPTRTATPTPTGIPPGTTNIGISITLTGIGVSQNPASGINNNPKRSQRNVEVMIVNSSNQQVDLTKSTINYDPATGKYKGNVGLGSNFISGSYLVKVRLDNTLWKNIPGIQNIILGQTYNAPEAALVPGDIIQDNEINLLDYNALLSCYGAKTCTTKVQADLNDDNKVDEVDLNILYAGFARRVGD